jgi:hypothetical protein
MLVSSIRHADQQILSNRKPITIAHVGLHLPFQSDHARHHEIDLLMLIEQNRRSALTV